MLKTCSSRGDNWLRRIWLLARERGNAELPFVRSGAEIGAPPWKTSRIASAAALRRAGFQKVTAEKASL